MYYNILNQMHDQFTNISFNEYLNIYQFNIYQYINYEIIVTFCPRHRLYVQGTCGPIPLIEGCIAIPGCQSVAQGWLTYCDIFGIKKSDTISI